MYNVSYHKVAYCFLLLIKKINISLKKIKKIKK